GRPLPVRYARWLRSVARGELGYSLGYDRPVASVLWPRARNTLILTVPATAAAWLLAVPIGAWIAARRGPWEDRLLAAITPTLLGVPDLLLGLLLVMSALRTGVLPAGGMVSVRLADAGGWAHVRDIATHLVLPASALVLLSLPVLVRHVRASVIEALAAP